MLMKRKPEPVTEHDYLHYQSSVVDLVRGPMLTNNGGLQQLYTVSRRRKSVGKVLSLVLQTTLKGMMGSMIAGAVIGFGIRLFDFLNNGAHVEAGSMYSTGSALFMNSAMGATLGGAIGLVLGLVAGVGLALVRQDLSDERAS